MLAAECVWTLGVGDGRGPGVGSAGGPFCGPIFGGRQAAPKRKAKSDTRLSGVTLCGSVSGPPGGPETGAAFGPVSWAISLSGAGASVDERVPIPSRSRSPARRRSCARGRVFRNGPRCFSMPLPSEREKWAELLVCLVLRARCSHFPTAQESSAKGHPPEDAERDVGPPGHQRMANPAAPPSLRPPPPFMHRPPLPQRSRSPAVETPLCAAHPAYDLTRPVLMDQALHRYRSEAHEEWFDSVGHIESVLTPEGQQWRVHMALPGPACLVVTALVTAVGVYQPSDQRTAFGPVRRRDWQEPMPEPFARPRPRPSDAPPLLRPRGMSPRGPAPSTQGCVMPVRPSG